MSEDAQPGVGEVEIECGVPIPGVILPPEQWAKTALKRLPEKGPIDWNELFGRSAPLVLELGCGNGRFLVGSALAHPDFNHIGIDALPMVIRYATRRGNQRGLHHTRFAVCGGLEFLDKYVANRSLRQLHIYHPQPFREPGQAQRRMLTPDFFALAHRRMELEGELFFQTDNPAYWKYFLEVAPLFFTVRVQEGVWPETPLGRTRREIVARSQGLTIFRATALPGPEKTEEEYQQLIDSLPLPDFDAMEGHPQAQRKQPPHRKSRRGGNKRRR